MEWTLVAIVASLLVAFFGSGAAIFGLPMQRWQFTFEGRSFEVRNFLIREELRVDGERIESTRVSGDGLTHATHGVALADGRALTIHITANGGGVRCTASVGEQVVFDSLAPPSLAGATLARLPGRAAPKADDRDPDDPRWPAALVLLAQLDHAADLAESAATVKTELRGALLRLAEARASARAHAALGGSDTDLDGLVAHREGVVDQILGLLRQLHLAASGRDVASDTGPRVAEALGRLEAEREVDEARLRQVAARRASETR